MDLETENEAITDIRHWILSDRSLYELEGYLGVVADIEHTSDLGIRCLEAINTINMLHTDLKMLDLVLDRMEGKIS